MNDCPFLQELPFQSYSVPCDLADKIIVWKIVVTTNRRVSFSSDTFDEFCPTVPDIPQPERRMQYIVRKMLTIYVFKLRFFLFKLRFKLFTSNLFNVVHCLYKIYHLERRLCYKLWLKCLQLFSRTKAPGHTYCIYLGCLSCFHICISISQIQTVFFLSPSSSIRATTPSGAGFLRMPNASLSPYTLSNV